MAKAEKAANVWTFRSKPPFQSWTSVEYFYDGEANVLNGRIEIPKKVEWAMRLLTLGYEWDGKVPEDFDGIL